MNHDNISAAITESGTRPGRLVAVGSVAVGDIVIAQGGGIRRVVLVADDLGDETMLVFLVTNEVELASDLDVIAEPETSGLPYRLIIQGELYGRVRVDQVVGRVGRVDLMVAESVRRSLVSDGKSLDGLPTGTPLGGIDDPRRAAKERELEDLHRLHTRWEG